MILRSGSLEKLKCHRDFLHIFSIALFTYQNPLEASSRSRIVYFWNAEGEIHTLPLTCTLYLPVLITKLNCFTNLYCILTSTEPGELATYCGLPRVSPVSLLCLYVCSMFYVVCSTVYVFPERSGHSFWGFGPEILHIHSVPEWQKMCL